MNNSRMNKYYENPEPLEKRTNRNEELYKSINKNFIEEYDINSNISVLDVPGNEINVEKIKEMLDERYKNPARRKSIVIEEEETIESVPLETKDYDLSKILERAKAEKSADYSSERLRKLRDTQYDILNKLNLERPEEEETISDAEQELITMIQTITSKENRDKSDNITDSSIELDLFEDLKGSENTVVVSPITEEQKVEYETRKEKNPIENSFYTGNLKVKENDYEDFKELKEEIKSNDLTIKILIFLFGIIVVIGLLFLFDKIFTWGLF